MNNCPSLEIYLPTQHKVDQAKNKHFLKFNFRTQSPQAALPVSAPSATRRTRPQSFI